MGHDLMAVLEQVGRDKGLQPAVLMRTLEQALLTAARRVFGEDRQIEAQFNTETGQVDLFLVCVVVDRVEVPGRDLLKAEVERHGLTAELGDELLFQIFYLDVDADRALDQEKKYGDLIGLRSTVKQFGRIAAQTAKQVIIQRIRDAERETVYQEYKDRKGELITGLARRFEFGNVIVDVGKTEAILPLREQISKENFRPGESVKAYVLEIDREGRGPQVILSRTHRGFLEKLFEQEVPEIREGIVRIEGSAREAGARSKIAVSCSDRNVDPVGACVGIRGSRVNVIRDELRGEKIDIVPYSPDPAQFVCNAMAPADVVRVIVDAENHKMELVVPDEKLSLAIGKRGQNVRLASQLTGWKIDIHAESKVKEQDRLERERMAQLDGCSDDLADALFRLGWRSVQDLAEARLDELGAVPGLGGESGARRIQLAAQQVQHAPVDAAPSDETGEEKEQG